MTGQQDEPRYTAAEWAKFQEMQASLDATRGAQQPPPQDSEAGALPNTGSGAEPGAQSGAASSGATAPVTIYWSNLASIRFWILALFLSFCVGVPSMYVLPDQVAGWLFWVYFPLIVAGLLFVGDALDCPKCGKNVKMGNSRCHHCGYDLPKTSAYAKN